MIEREPAGSLLVTVMVVVADPLLVGAKRIGSARDR
jgi:hypothetical protein